MADLIPPHGGLTEPVCRTVEDEAVDDFLARAETLCKVPVSEADLSTVYRFGDGGLSPLIGPMDSATYDRVLEESVIEHNGDLYAWAIPLALPVTEQMAGELGSGQEVALVNASGEIVATLQISVLAHEPRMNQPNDLAIDSQDRVYASDPNWSNGTGQLWRVDADGAATLLEEGMGTTNGIEVSPGNSHLYVNESAQRRIWVYDLDASGNLQDKRLLIEFPDYGLDGMRCDVDGVLYVARFGKGVVARISPSGDVLGEVPLGGTNPSNLAFGGPDGCTCYVTVADQKHVEAFRVDRPGRSWQLFQENRTQVAPRTWGRIKRDG